MSPLNAQEQTETAVRGGLEGLVADPPGGGVGATPTNVKIATSGATTKKRLKASKD